MTTASATFSGPQYYDEYLGPVWFEAYAADIARRLPQQPHGDVLEIACGTGILTKHLRECLDRSTRLVATDLSIPMLDYARRKCGDLPNVKWHEANALKLPFEDRSFGAVVCGFGIMFVPDRAGALRETRRVLIDGGVLLFNVWDRIENNPPAAANALVLESLFPGDAEMSFRAPFDMYDVDFLRGLLKATGFRAVRIETVRIPIDGANPRKMATGQIRGTPRSALIEKRGVPLDMAIDKVTEALKNSGGDPYHAHTQAVIVDARAI